MSLEAELDCLETNQMAGSSWAIHNSKWLQMIFTRWPMVSLWFLQTINSPWRLSRGRPFYQEVPPQRPLSATDSWFSRERSVPLIVFQTPREQFFTPLGCFLDNTHTCKTKTIVFKRLLQYIYIYMAQPISSVLNAWWCIVFYIFITRRGDHQHEFMHMPTKKRKVQPAPSVQAEKSWDTVNVFLSVRLTNKCLQQGDVSWHSTNTETIFPTMSLAKNLFLSSSCAK